MHELMRMAGFPTETIEEILEYIYKLEEAGQWNKILGFAEDIMENPRTRLGEILSQAEHMEDELGLHKYTIDILILLQCWLMLQKKYSEKGLPREIFKDSLADMRCKLQECRKVYGVTGIFVGGWYDRFFDISRFALGRLQFETEIYPYNEPFVYNGHTVKKGDKVINVHIPSLGPLKMEEVTDSLNRAVTFYKEYFPEGCTKFVCYSWLLDTDLQEILPEGNLRLFTSLFHVVDVKKEEVFEDGWRVFGQEWNKEAKDLPRHTKLQKNIADYLQQGKELGEGYGVLFYE